MLHLTWKGLCGRRRESLLLLIVLVLAFLLSSALGLILPSTQAELQLHREQTYGKWQIMACDKDDALCTALEDAAAQSGAQAARLRTAARTEAGDLVSVLTPEVLELSQLSLLDGQLPTAANEIVLVDTQFSDMDGIQVGDEIRLQFTQEVGCSASEQVRADGEALLAQYTQQAMDADETDYYQKFLDSVARAGEKQGEDRVVINRAAGFCLSDELYEIYQDNLKYNRPLLDGMTPEQIETLYQSYLKEGISLYLTNNSRSNERILIPYEPASVCVVQTVSKTALYGSGFGEFRGSVIQTGRTYSYMVMTVTYTVSGILRGYESTWDAGGHVLPDAFVSEAGEALLCDGIQAAQDALADLTVPDSSDTLLLYSEEDTPDFYAQMAAVYIAAAEPRYDVFSYTNRTYNITEGFLVGLRDADVPGAEPSRVSLSFSTRNGQVYVYTQDGEPIISGNAFAPGGEWVSISELSAPGFRIAGLSPLSVTVPEIDELYLENEYDFRINAYTYPDETGSSDATLNTVLNGILVLLTAFSVLVICLVQCRRRARSIVLLRAIGLQAAQAMWMQLCEGGIFLVLSLAAGLPLGLLGGLAVLHARGSGEVLALDWGFLLRSVIFGAGSLLAGMQLPLLAALRMPLTGRSGTLNPRTSAADGRPLKRGGLLPMENAARRFNRRRDQTARLLCALMVLLSLLTLLLSHLALNAYRTQVERTDMPDYTLQASFAMSPRYLTEKRELFTAQDELGEQPSRVEEYLAAEGVYLTNFQDSPTVSALADDAFCVAGLREDSPILARLLELCGPIDLDKLLSGEGCILLMPNYLPAEAGELQFSADPVDRLRYQTDDTIQPGDTLSLRAYSHGVSEGSGVYASICNVEVEVLAVLHEYSGIWLFGESAHPLTAVSGQSLITALYPNASQRYNADQARWNQRLSQLHCENCKGKTYVNFYASDDADHAASYWKLAQSEGMDMKNYQKEKAERLAAGKQQRSLTALLGIAAVLLVLIILSFILSDLAEQSRRRVGILRALGTSGGAVLRAQLLLSMREALGAVLLANGVIALLLFVCALVETGGHSLQPSVLLSTLQNGLLWKYPWLLHGLICLGAWALISLLRTLPYRALCRQSVIGTIKGLEKGE